MIEIIKEETLEKREGAFGLPKNIRQIGDAQEGTKVYIEDYVMTYLKQSAAYTTEEDEAFVLYGNKMEIVGTSYYFVSGTLRVSKVNSCLYNLLFDEEDWKKINEEAALYFPSLSVLGWALLREEDTDMFDYRIAGTHERYFRKEQEVFFEYSKTEKEERVYLYRDGKMEKQKGHYIYYDKNDLMQNYMVSMKEEKEKVEDEHVDNAAKKFRMVVQEKKEQKRRHRTNVLLYSAATVLAFVILLIGITMLNNYEKMQNMERVLYQIASEATSENVQNVTEPEGELQVMEEEGDKEAVLETIGEPETSIIPTVSGDAVVFNDPAGTESDETMQIGEQGMVTQTGSDETNQGQNEENATKDTDNGEKAADGEQAVERNKTQTSEGVTNETQPGEQTATGETEQKTDSPETTEQDDNKDQDNQNKVVEEASDESRQTIKTTYQTYIIRKGDTLEKINQLFYGNVNRIDEICSLNNIKNKDNICYGEKIILP